MNTSRRVVTIVILIIALIATGYTRQFASAMRGSGSRALGTGGAQASNAAQLTRMNSFALTLLLGGLRGPLVMILWSSSESQKTEKNLEDFDTKVEWIRLLQPEFDSVHIFQIWNKAYNISVQMASLSNKYLTIIDALDYAFKVDRERPDNLNIVYAIGSVYGDKLGDSAEKVYYNRRVREDSLPHAAKQKLAANAVGERRLELDTILDANGNVLPSFVAPTQVHLTDPNNPNADVYDGSQLGFLKRFQPYPYGVAPYGFAYAYRKRAQLLQRYSGQRHAQISDLVVDSRPALDLKKWGEAEQIQSRRAEVLAVNRVIPPETIDMEALTANIPPNVSLDDSQKAKLREAVFSLDLAQRLWEGSDAEYVEHLTRYKNNLQLYQSHRDELVAQRALAKADHDYLQVILLPKDSPQRAELLKSAKESYRRAVVRYALLLLHYLPLDVLEKSLPPGVNKSNFAATMDAKADQMTPELIMPIVGTALKNLEDLGYRQPDEAGEYMTYIRRCLTRISLAG